MFPGDQVAIITASSESDFSASEFHVPRSESDRERSPNIKLQEDKFLKRGKKVPQKVPSFSSRRMLDLKEQVWVTVHHPPYPYTDVHHYALPSIIPFSGCGTISTRM